MAVLDRLLRVILPFRDDDDEQESVNIKVIIAEAIIILSLLYAVGFFMSKEDPLFLDSEYGLALNLIPLTLLTLFYGFLSGLIYVGLFSIALLATYQNFQNSYHVLIMLFYLLLFTEFHFFWNKRIQTFKEKFEYINTKLRDVARSLYMLKVSHDRLESYHLGKPVSIRGVIEELTKDLISGLDLDSAMKRGVFLICNLYMVEKACLYKYEDNHFTEILRIGDFESLEMEDPLVRQSLQDSEVVYVPASSIEDDTKYLCSIPLYRDKRLSYLFVIESMPFFNLNSENVLGMSMILQYINLEYSSVEGLRPLIEKFSGVSLEMLKEINRAIKLRERYGVNSSVVAYVFSTFNEGAYTFIADSVRAMDVVSRYGRNSILVFLPFTDPLGASTFVKRTENRMKEEEVVFAFGKYRVYINRVEDFDLLIKNVESDEMFAALN